MRRSLGRVLSAAALGAVALLLVVPGLALAHERRTIANGKYDVVVGWDTEPAYQGQKNAATIRISQAGSNPPAPVAGAEKTLKLQIKQGAQTRDMPLRAVFGQDGLYAADILPERTGDYQLIFTGSIDGNAVNETFDSADGKFNGVEPVASIRFPSDAASDPAQVAASVQQAQAEARNAQLLGIAGLVVGALGLLAAGTLWFTRPRTIRAAAAGRSATERA